LRLKYTSKEKSETPEPQRRNNATLSLSGQTEAARILEPFSTGKKTRSERLLRGRKVEASESTESTAHKPLEIIATNESETLTDVMGEELRGYASEAETDDRVKSQLNKHSNSVANPSLSPDTNQSRFLWES
jgi:hypothetical protein